MEVLLNDAAAAELLAKLRESVGAGNDHALRGAADEYIYRKLDRNPNMAVHSLLVVLSLQDSPDWCPMQPRAYELLDITLPGVFNRLSNEVKAEVRSAVLRALRVGPEGQGQRQALECAKLVARIFTERGENCLPCISAALIEMAGSGNVEVAVVGCKVLRVVLAEALDAFVSDVSEEALDALSRHLIKLWEIGDPRTALPARQALMTLFSRTNETPLPALLDAAPRLLEALIRAIRDDNALELVDWWSDDPCELGDIVTIMNASPRVGLDHTTGLLETVAKALAMEERDQEMLDQVQGVFEVLCEDLQAEPADSPAVGALVEALPRFMPVLLRGMLYTAEDPAYWTYQMQQARGDPPGAMQEEEEEEEDAMNQSSPRRSCTLMLECLVENRPSEVVPVLLAMASAMVRAGEPGFQVPDALSEGVAPEKAWMIKEAGIVAILRVASAHPESLDAHIPTIIPVLASCTRAQNPLVVSMACWSLGQMAPYVKARVHAQGQQAVDGQLGPMLQALSPCIDHDYPYVRAGASIATIILHNTCPAYCTPYLADALDAVHGALERPGCGPATESVVMVCEVICAVLNVAPELLSNADAARVFTSLRTIMLGQGTDLKGLTKRFRNAESLLKHEGVLADPELPLSLMDLAVKVVREHCHDNEDPGAALFEAAVDYICLALEVLNGRCAEGVDGASLCEVTDSLLRNGLKLDLCPAIGANLLRFYPGRAPLLIVQRMVEVAVSLCHERQADEVAVVPWLLAFLVPVVAPNTPGASAKVAVAAAHMLACASATIDAGEGEEYTFLGLQNAALALSAVAVQDPAVARVPAAGCIREWLQSTCMIEVAEEVTETWRGIAAMAEHDPEVFGGTLPHVVSSLNSHDPEFADEGDFEAWKRVRSALGGHFGDEWWTAAADLELGEVIDTEDDEELLG